MSQINGDAPVLASRAEPDRIPEKTMNELKTLAKITGHSLNGIIAGWWVRIGEVQTLQMELSWCQIMLEDCQNHQG